MKANQLCNGVNQGANVLKRGLVRLGKTVGLVYIGMIFGAYIEQHYKQSKEIESTEQEQQEATTEEETES